MKLFLDIGKSQQELILAIILACSIIGMLLLFGLGLSDATQQGMSFDRISGQQPKCPNSTRPPCTLDAAKSGITANRGIT